MLDIDMDNRRMKQLPAPNHNQLINYDDYDFIN